MDGAFASLWLPSKKCVCIRIVQVYSSIKNSQIHLHLLLGLILPLNQQILMLNPFFSMVSNLVNLIFWNTKTQFNGLCYLGCNEGFPFSILWYSKFGWIYSREKKSKNLLILLSKKVTNFVENNNLCFKSSTNLLIEEHMFFLSFKVGEDKHFLGNMVSQE